MVRRLVLTLTTLLVLVPQHGTAIRSNVFVRAADVQDRNNKASKMAEKGKGKDAPTSSPAPSISIAPSISQSPSCGDGMECDDPAPKVISNEIYEANHGVLSLFDPPDGVEEPEDEKKDVEIADDASHFVNVQSSLLAPDESSSSASSIWRFPLTGIVLLAYNNLF
mmetsp:Transcript_8987/g.14988  ORF Transcript_8987/g.14988 Transcript_8987/m.14988 type:complete len:166 (+) Transcript_8987:103-600(+)